MQQRRHRHFIIIALLSSLLVGVFSSLIVFQHTAQAGTGEPAGSNIAVGVPASADSQQASQPASSGNDGDATTYWCAADGNAGHWWQIDLQTYSNLTGVGINFGVSKYYQYTVAVSRNGTNWHQVVDQARNMNTDPYQYDSFNAQAERYVRITITGMQAGQWACFAEFKVYALSQGENVALNKTVTADSQQSNHPASAVTNGSVNPGWSPSGNGASHWLSVDLKYVYNLTGTQVIWGDTDQPYRYRIDTSLDGVNWRTVVARIQPPATRDINAVRYDSFASTKARYVRITVTAFSHAGTSVSIDQFEAFQPFMKGVDASTLLLMEQHGAVYSDNGVKENFLQILKNNGVNYVRLRLWVNPGNAPQDQPGVNDLTSTMTMARQIKALGLQFFLDFHYSDTWADPGHQTVPAAWANETPSQLAQTVHDYTENVISQLNAQGTLPDMVQIGNETNCGMLWPTGDVCTNSANWSNYASYVNAGIKGVHDALHAGQTVRIALHYAGDAPQWWLNDLLANGVTGFDTIALSYYIFWHGPLSSLAQAIPSLKSTYGRDVIVAEFAYPWTFQNFDSTSNSVTSSTVSSQIQAAYPVTPAGQTKLVEDELATVKDSGGLGAFYWEPGWYAVPGAGWIDNQGDGWENMTQVDQSGNALPSLSVYSRY